MFYFLSQASQCTFSDSLLFAMAAPRGIEFDHDQMLETGGNGDDVSLHAGYIVHHGEMLRVKTYVRVHDFGLEVLCGKLDDLVGRGVESCNDGLREEECPQGNGGEALLHVDEEEGCDEG